VDYYRIRLAFAAALGLGTTTGAFVQWPSSIASGVEIAVTTLHAEGAQVYECKAANDGKLTWQFREPVATLLLGGRTVGRHYAGPTWEHVDGSIVMATPIASTPGKTLADIPWLELEAGGRRGAGTLSDVTTVKRINTRGGVLSGACEEVGSYRSAPYAADYVFLHKGS
jgi:hypothetical protein